MSSSDHRSKPGSGPTPPQGEQRGNVWHVLLWKAVPFVGVILWDLFNRP
jgi:hypothetical protein